MGMNEKESVFQKWKALFLYGGLSRQEYASIRSDIHQQNMRDLRAYCTVAALLLGISAAAVLISSAFNSTTAYVYCLGAALSLLLIFLSGHTKDIDWIENILKYAFICIIYGFGILVTLAQPESLAVLFMVILVLVPLLFSGSPSEIFIFTIGAVLFFSVYEIILKDPQIVTVDLWNAVTYGLLGIFVGVIVQRVRLQNIIQLRKIAMLSESDLLTGLKNRNSFEQNPAVYGNMMIKDITCIYADINGLHELNNTKGHKAGDVMLQTVAGSILSHFGREHSYRVGGDEFVIFTFGQTEEETQKQIDEINKECLQKGYHVSFGFSCGKDIPGSMDSLIRSAEDKMYIVKAEYYRSIGRERQIRK